MPNPLPEPLPLPAPAVGPALFRHDPYAIHRRSLVTDPESLGERSDLQPEARADAQARSVERSDADEPCSAVCGMQKIEGAKNEKEALCSVEGLRATLECASCIDDAWPDTTWEESAMAEYDRIVEACESNAM